MFFPLFCIFIDAITFMILTIFFIIFFSLPICTDDCVILSMFERERCLLVEETKDLGCLSF